MSEFGKPLRVLLVTSWGNACGIAEHSALLAASVEAADPAIEVIPSAKALDPAWVLAQGVAGYHVVHLNHHDALHSRWTPELVQQIRASGTEVVVTYHDTRSGDLDSPNSDKLKAFTQVASSVVVHEPTADVKAIYWRQGVPAAARSPVDYTPYGFLAVPQQPILGTVGFNFPWKNYDRLAQLTGELGWALVLLANNATPEDEARWRASNSSILVLREFLSQPQVLNYLAGCDATAFMYECSNTGTSGAIRQGIAARKPVLALKRCRQFRDLQQERGIGWLEDWNDCREALKAVRPGRYDPRLHDLAERDSWTKLGAQYAQLYRTLVGEGGPPRMPGKPLNRARALHALGWAPQIPFAQGITQTAHAWRARTR